MHLFFNFLTDLSFLDRSINKFQFFSIIKSLNLHYLISTQSISLKFTGMIAIESLHVNFQIILKSFMFLPKFQNFSLNYIIVLFYTLILEFLPQNFIKNLFLKPQMDHF